MNTLYSLEGSRVLYRGCDELGNAELTAALWYAMRRKMRLVHFEESFFAELRKKGEASITWNFTRHNHAHENHWVSFHAWEDTTTGRYRLYCVGPQAEYVLQRINTICPRDTMRGYMRLRWQEDRKHTRVRTRRLERKRKHLEVRRITAPRQDKKVKAARPFVPAVLSLRHNEVLTPQFRKNRLAWSEAVTETVRIFEARGNWKYTARERVASELWGSLERSGYRFAQYKRGGFCLRFDLTDGRWRGDITPLTVSCTKDNTHPTYRRMRKILKERLTGLSQEEQHQRKALLWHEDSQIAA